MEENKTTDLEKKIVDDLLKTGFPLEVSVADTLNAARWRVNPSALYIDPDSKITRELDIYALKFYNKYQDTVDGISLASHLIIQCKKSNKPWVFFDNGGESLFWLGFYSLNSPKEDFMSTLCFHGETIGFNDHRYKDVKRHRSFHTAFNDKAQDKGLYDGLITSCKALGYFRHMYSRINKTAHFFTPIIVLDGTLWSASLSRDSGISIKQVDKLLVDFDYIFGEDKKPSKMQNQIIEVITEREFQNVVKEIEKDNNVLLKSWVNFLELNKEK